MISRIRSISHSKKTLSRSSARKGEGAGKEVERGEKREVNKRMLLVVDRVLFYIVFSGRPL